MRNLLLVTVLVTLANVAVFGKDKPQYQVGTFVEKEMVSDGSLVSTGYSHAKKVEQGHYVYHVSGDTGEFYIDAPTSIGMSILASMATEGQSADIHKQSFLDTLHQGDKVLFVAKCNKHNRCEFDMPNPDNPKKTVRTFGSFEPMQGKSNVSSLCGTGKLSASIEQQYCGAGAVGPLQSPVVQPETPPTTESDPAEAPSSMAAPAERVAPPEPAPAAAKRSTAAVAAPRRCISSMTDSQGNETCMHYADEQQ